MRVQYFTFVINPTEQDVLFRTQGNKVDLFKTILLSKDHIKFTSHNVNLAIVRVFDDNDYAIFRIGKHETVKLNRSPEEKFEVESVSNWPHCLLFINFDDSPSGHRIAIEYNPDLFRDPYVQLQALAKEINQHLVFMGYVVEINAVTTRKKFWETVEENENQIQKLILIFNSPNFLQLKSVLSDELKNIEKEYGATRTTIEIENPEGKLKIPHSELIKQGTEYITKGGGSYKLKVKKQRGFIKDKDNIETKEVIDINLESQDKDLILQALDKIFNKDA